jgi:Transposase
VQSIGNNPGSLVKFPLISGFFNNSEILGELIRPSFDNILAFVDRNLTNAVGEGLNRIVKIVKNRASGYRNLESFADMIYLTIGDLDIPAQIPSHLRTL